MMRPCLIIFACFVRLTTFSTAFTPRSRGSFSKTSFALEATITPGDTIVVVGATGGVGQLVTQKLRKNQFNVRVTSRNVDQARTILDGPDDVHDPIDVVPLDLIQGSTDQLSTALQGACGLVISVGTTAFPTMKWRGGNTPQAIDADAVTKLVQAATAVSTMRKIILITSVGV